MTLLAILLTMILRISYDFGIKIRARALTTIPDSTSQKFILLGQLSRNDAGDNGRFVVIFLDFSPTRLRKCTEDDFEKWYARTASGHECLMGHKVYALVGCRHIRTLTYLPSSNGTRDVRRMRIVMSVRFSATPLSTRTIASVQTRISNGVDFRLILSK